MAFEDRQNRAQYPFGLGQPLVFNLNPGSNILEGHVIINATVTITGAGAVGVPIGEGGAMNLVKEIRVVTNKAPGSRYPNGTILKATPQDLVRFAISERGGKYMSVRRGDATLGGGAAGVYPIYLDIPLYFADSTNKNNVQTSLNMNPVDSTGAPIYVAVQVQVDLAAAITDLFAGNANAMTVAGWVQWKDDRVQLVGDSVPILQEGHYAYIQNANMEFVDAAMPTTGRFMQWLIMTQAGSPGFQLADTILNKILLNGSGINFKEYADDIQQQMYNDGFYDPAQSTTGQYFLDFTKGLPIANSNPAAGLNHQFDVNNPSGAGNDRLRIFTRRILDLTPAASK